MACAARTASPSFKVSVSIGPQGLERGNQSKDDAGQNGDAESVKEQWLSRAISSERAHWWPESRENAHAQLRQKSPCSLPRCQAGRFGKQLGESPERTGSKSSANRKFATAAGGTSEKEIGDVGAAIKSTKLTAPSSTSKIPFTLPTTSALSGIRESRCLCRLPDMRRQDFPQCDSCPRWPARWLRRASGDRWSSCHADAPVAESRIGPLTDGNVEVGGTESGDTALSHPNDC